MRFLEKICKKSLEFDLRRTVIVLPSQRSALYIREEFKKTDITAILPEMMTMDNFVQRASGMKQEDNLKMAVISYRTFAEENKMDFDEFLPVFDIMLKDFNDIDMYLLDEEKLNNIKEVAELEHVEKGTFAENYFNTMKKIKDTYSALNNELFKVNRGYRGMIYRIAAENQSGCDDFDNILIAGFNILTPSEVKLINELIKKKKVKIFFDIPPELMKAKHESAQFISFHLKRWGEYAENLGESINEKIEIRSYSLPVNQTEILSDIFNDRRGTVVLCDETLMMPTINGLPETVNKINITMGYPLIQTPIAQFIVKILRMHSEKIEKGFYYKSVINLIDSIYIKKELGGHYNTIRGRLFTGASSFVSYEDIFKEFASDLSDEIFLWYDERKNLLPLTLVLKKIANSVMMVGSLEENDVLSESNSVKIVQMLNKLITLFQKNDSLKIQNNVSKIDALVRRIISGENVPFSGDPLQDFQVMGMLESRCLEFDKTVALSVNEGIMPKGKSQSSFIPNDLREMWGLPTYKYTDALFSYYFYSLLFKSREFYTVYAEGGEENYNEKSRFVEQMIWESRKGGLLEGRVNMLSKNYDAESLISIEKIEKTERMMKRLYKIKYSPTSLTTYIMDPIRFFFETVLNIPDENERNEVGANIIGTAAHEILNILYEKNKGIVFNGKSVILSDVMIEKMIKDSFAKNKIYKTESGKSYLMKRVIIELIKNFVKADIERISGKVKLIDLEGELNGSLEIYGTNILLKGKFDRIEDTGDEIKICDYKTGMMNETELKIKERGKLIDLSEWKKDNTKYAKIFQLLFYGYLAYNDKRFSGKKITMAIYSLRKPNDVFNLLYSSREGGEKVVFDENINDKFESILKSILEEILNKNRTFNKNQTKEL